MTASHVYGDNGFYSVTVTITDEENMYGSTSAAATIVNANPSLQIVDPVVTLSAGQNAMSAIEFIDASGDTHTASIDWGDGTSSAANVRRTQVEASHTYAVAGTYNTVITVTDDDGGQSSGLVTFVVSQDGATISIPSVSKWGLVLFSILVISIFVIRNRTMTGIRR